MPNSPPPPSVSLVADPLDGDDDVLAPAPSRLPLLIIVVLALVAIGGTIDLILDKPATLFSLHVLFELALVLFSLSSIAVIAGQWRRTSAELEGTRRSLEATRRSLETRQVERDAWRRSAEDALAGLGVAIDRQFTAWGLTPTEREIALLLLKGYGHKQVAANTGRSERTVRQHAVAVYQKAGLGGRAELAAFFLQDLMLPGELPEAR